MEICLRKNEFFFTENKFFIVKKGKVIVKKILENGEIISNENLIKKDEIVGNFLLLSDIDFLPILNIEVKIECLEECILKEIKVSKEEINSNEIIKKIFLQLIKAYTIKLFSHIYKTNEYILILLKYNCDENGKILKQNINFESFNISKSQYYLSLSSMKKENLLEENSKEIRLNLKKIESFFYLRRNYN